MTPATFAVFALAAGLGAPLRFLIDSAVGGGTGAGAPRGTLLVNAAGSLLLGMITGLTLRGHVSSDVATVIGTGFCGALTTFSTFAAETVRLLEHGAVGAAFRNVALNATIAVGLAAIGYAAVLGIT